MSYGPRPDEVDTLVKKGDPGIEEWINEQLHPEKINNLEVDRKLLQFKSLSMSIAELHQAYPKPKQELKESLATQISF
jgi:hypothetical protein